MQDLDHKHLVVTAAIAKPPTTVKHIEEWLLKVVDAVDMKVFMEPRATRCDTQGNEGVTGVVGLETSHCSIHVWEGAEVPFLKFDIYSCKRFDPNVVLECMQEFEPYYFQTMLIDRNETIKIADQADVQVASIIDMMDEGQREHYLAANRKEARENGLSLEQKSARSAYASLERKYSVKRQRRDTQYKNGHHATLKVIKSRALAKGLDYDLTPEWYAEALSEAQKKWPRVVAHGSEDSFWRATVDQIVPGLGYTQENCRIIPHALNVAKWKWHKRELEELTILLIEETKKNLSFVDRIKLFLKS